MSIYGILPYLLEKEKEESLILENKPSVISLKDGRKVHLLIENPATQKPKPAPLTEDQKQNQYFLAIVAFFVLLAICMVCTFFATI